MYSFFLHEQWCTIELSVLALCRQTGAATEMKMGFGEKTLARQGMRVMRTVRQNSESRPRPWNKPFVVYEARRRISFEMPLLFIFFKIRII